MREIRRLACDPPGRFDLLLVESTGISLPLPVAATFGAVDPDSGQQLLGDVAALDTLVTVVGVG